MDQMYEHDEIRDIIPFADWMDSHPRIANFILWLMAIALMYAVVNYEFTTTI